MGCGLCGESGPLAPEVQGSAVFPGHCVSTWELCLDEGQGTPVLSVLHGVTRPESTPEPSLPPAQGSSQQSCVRRGVLELLDV